MKKYIVNKEIWNLGTVIDLHSSHFFFYNFLLPVSSINFILFNSVNSAIKYRKIKRKTSIMILYNENTLFNYAMKININKEIVVVLECLPFSRLSIEIEIQIVCSIEIR